MWTFLPFVLAAGLTMGADTVPPAFDASHDRLRSLRPTAASARLLDPRPAPLAYTSRSAIPDTLYARGERDGYGDGLEAPIRNAALGGFGWSLVGGPLGGVVAVRRTRSASFPIPRQRTSSLDELGGGYRDGYMHGFGEAFRPRRREATLVGSMVGSLVWGYAMIRILNLPGRAEARGQIPDGGTPN